MIAETGRDRRPGAAQAFALEEPEPLLAGRARRGDRVRRGVEDRRVTTRDPTRALDTRRDDEARLSRRDSLRTVDPRRRVPLRHEPLPIGPLDQRHRSNLADRRNARGLSGPSPAADCRSGRPADPGLAQRGPRAGVARVFRSRPTWRQTACGGLPRSWRWRWPTLPRKWPAADRGLRPQVAQRPSSSRLAGLRPDCASWPAFSVRARAGTVGVTAVVGIGVNADWPATGSRPSLPTS